VLVEPGENLVAVIAAVRCPALRNRSEGRHASNAGSHNLRNRKAFCAAVAMNQYQLFRWRKPEKSRPAEYVRHQTDAPN